MDRGLRQEQSEQVAKSFHYAAHIETANDVPVYAPAHQTVTVPHVAAAITLPGTKLPSTLEAIVLGKDCLGNPLFYAAVRKSQIKKHTVAVLSMLNFSGSAMKALPGRQDELLIRTQLCPLQLSVLLIDRLKPEISPQEDLLALIVEVGAFVDMLESLQCIFFASEHPPSWFVRA